MIENDKWNVWNEEREARHHFGTSPLSPEEKVATVKRAIEFGGETTEEEWAEIIRQYEAGLLIDSSEILKLLKDDLSAPKTDAEAQA
jgi:hypothetical protein